MKNNKSEMNDKAAGVFYNRGKKNFFSTAGTCPAIFFASMGLAA
jgi:hypothetical protein